MKKSLVLGVLFVTVALNGCKSTGAGTPKTLVKDDALSTVPQPEDGITCIDDHRTTMAKIVIRTNDFEYRIIDMASAAVTLTAKANLFSPGWTGEGQRYEDGWRPEGTSGHTLKLFTMVNGNGLGGLLTTPEGEKHMYCEDGRPFVSITFQAPVEALSGFESMSCIEEIVDMMDTARGDVTGDAVLAAGADVYQCRDKMEFLGATRAIANRLTPYDLEEPVVIDPQEPIPAGNPEPLVVEDKSDNLDDSSNLYD